MRIHFNMNYQERLNQIKIENYIWIIYLVIIILSYYANYFEKDYFLTKNENSKNTYRKLNSIVFIILIIIYSYFEKDAISSFKNKDKSKKQKEYDTLSLIASTLVLISGFIFLYIILKDKDIGTEIAFN